MVYMLVYIPMKDIDVISIVTYPLIGIHNDLHAHWKVFLIDDGMAIEN